VKPKKTTKKKSELTSDAALDLEPDAWERFEALVKSAAKMGHRPHDDTAVPRKKRSSP